MLTRSSGNTYNALGQPTGIFSDCMSMFEGANLRYHEATYDALGRVTESKITSDEHITDTTGGYDTFTRIFNGFVYDGNGNGFGDILLFGDRVTTIRHENASATILD